MKKPIMLSKVKILNFNAYKKEIIGSITLLFLIYFYSPLQAQLPASTVPQNKKAVIEEFTGIYCGFCPDGHKVADQIYNADPNNVILINIHPSNSFGIPTKPGDVDLRTTDGASIDNIINFNPGLGGWAYPSAAINRSILTQTHIPNGSRPTWSNDVATIKSQPAYCNVALQGTVDVNTRVLTVQAQVYYTANSPQSTNYITVMLLENKISGKQSGDKFYYPANINSDSTYNHKHTLRKVLTSTFGNPINTTTSGSTFNTSLTYTVPLKYGMAPYDNDCMLGNLELVAFVTEKTQTLTINGARGPITLTGFSNNLDIATSNIKNDNQVCEAKFNSQFKFTNLGGSTVTSAVFSYSINGVVMPNYNWSGSVVPFSQSPTIFLPTANFLALPNNTLQIDVVSVNGSTDQNPSNNASGVNAIPQTTIVAGQTNMQIIFTQDRYGTECNWKLYNESTGALVTSDGPWSNLSSNGTQMHIKNFTAVNNTCYKLVVYDALGNGINSSYGSGFYTINSGSNVIYASNGKYDAGETIWFKVNTTLGLTGTALNINNVSVYPNPANNHASLSVELNQPESVNLLVLNNIGQIIYSENKNLDAGSNNIEINSETWASGVYNIKVITPNGTVNQKLNVIK